MADPMRLRRPKSKFEAEKLKFIMRKFRIAKYTFTLKHVFTKSLKTFLQNPSVKGVNLHTGIILIPEIEKT